MLIVWGTKIVRKRGGWVAEHCPICQDVCTCEIVSIHAVSHVYYIPFGDGKIVGHEVTCKRCGMVFGTQPGNYAEISNDPKTPVEELLEETRSHRNERMVRRMELAEKLKAGTLDADERMQMILEPLAMFNSPVTLRVKQTQFDRVSGIACGATIAITIGLCLLISTAKDHALNPALIDILTYFTIAFAVIGALSTLTLIATDVRRFVKREVIPKLAQAFARVNPTEEELDEAIAVMKDHRLEIGKRVNTAQILAAIEANSVRHLGYHYAAST